MASDPNRVGLFLLVPRGWSLAGHGGADFAAAIGDLLANRAQWSDEALDPDRSAAFAALHAHPDAPIAADISEALRQLAERAPILAAEAIAGLHALDDWSVAPPVSRLLREDSVADPANAIALNVYLAQSRGFALRPSQRLDASARRSTLP